MPPRACSNRRHDRAAGRRRSRGRSHSGKRRADINRPTPRTIHASERYRKSGSRPACSRATSAPDGWPYDDRRDASPHAPPRGPRERHAAAHSPRSNTGQAGLRACGPFAVQRCGMDLPDTGLHLPQVGTRHGRGVLKLTNPAGVAFESRAKSSSCIGCHPMASSMRRGVALRSHHASLWRPCA